MRRGFFKVFENCGSSLMPELFKLNSQLFKFIQDYAVDEHLFQRKYALYSMPALLVVVLLMLVYGAKTLQESKKHMSIFLELLDGELEAMY